MIYNKRMGLILAALLLTGPVRAAASDDKPAAAESADKTTIDLVNYFLKVDLSEANPKLIDPFLAVKTETLPKKLQRKTAAKQTEIAALLRIHDIKKKGIFVQTAGQACDETSFVKPLSLASAFPSPLPYEVVTEDELKCVMEQTKCTEDDLGCRFSMLIFFEKKKDRIIKFNASDPIMAIVAGCRGSGGTSHFFGMNYTCMH